MATTGKPRAVALIDGEHYPPVVRAAVEELAKRFDVRAALFLGGSEKLRPVSDGDGAYGVPVRRPDGGDPLRCLMRLVTESGAEWVVDLSDEPVVGYRERLRLASAALAAGAVYVGADFELRPPRRTALPYPVVSVIGTGKRVGKTAVGGHLARTMREPPLSAGGVVVVAMGRGGPDRPEIVHGEHGVEVADLLAVSRAGSHAASDHFEDAALAGVTTIGSRRCGGGLAGSPFMSNIDEAFALLPALSPELVIVEGSGSVIPPAMADATVCVASAAQPVDYVSGYLGTFRLLISDVVVMTMCEPPFAPSGRLDELRTAIAAVRADLPVVPTVFRPRPCGNVTGRRVAYFTTAPSVILGRLTRHLTEVHGAHVVAASADLADRSALDRALHAAREADAWLTELKAAAVDVVAEAADRAGKQLILCDNELRATGDDAALDGLALRLVGLARERARRRSACAPPPAASPPVAGGPEVV